MTSPIGAAMRRTARASTKPARASRTRPPANAPGIEPRCPFAPTKSATARALAPKTTTKSVRSRTTPRRRKNVRMPGHPPAGPERHAPGPRGGHGSPSGHQGGRNPLGAGTRRWGSPLSGIGEPVPDAVHGQQVTGTTGRRLDLLADVLHVGVDRSLVRLERDPGHGREQLGALEHPAGPPDA